VPSNTIRIRLVRSMIGEKQGARDTLRALGLRRVGQSVERPDTPAVRGMIVRVAHLVALEDANAVA
jgi:large subunit ribosomal protein L30